MTARSKTRDDTALMYRKRIEELERENARLRGALERYSAKESTWPDAGEIAQAALAAAPEGEKK